MREFKMIVRNLDDSIHIKCFIHSQADNNFQECPIHESMTLTEHQEHGDLSLKIIDYLRKHSLNSLTVNRETT